MKMLWLHWVKLNISFKVISLFLSTFSHVATRKFEIICVACLHGSHHLLYWAKLSNVPANGLDPGSQLLGQEKWNMVRKLKQVGF